MDNEVDSESELNLIVGKLFDVFREQNIYEKVSGEK